MIHTHTHTHTHIYKTERKFILFTLSHFSGKPHSNSLAKHYNLVIQPWPVSPYYSLLLLLSYFTLQSPVIVNCFLGPEHIFLTSQRIIPSTWQSFTTYLPVKSLPSFKSLIRCQLFLREFLGSHLHTRIKLTTLLCGTHVSSHLSHCFSLCLISFVSYHGFLGRTKRAIWSSGHLYR